MNLEEEKKDIIRAVRQNGNALSSYVAYQDDEEVVANAILGCDFGGIGVLQYASKRLQNDSKLLLLAEYSKRFQDYRLDALSSSKSKEKISRDLEKIEDAKNQILEEYFSKKNEKENNSQKKTIKDPFLEKIVIPDILKKYIDRGVIGTIINYNAPTIIDHLGHTVKNCIDYNFGVLSTFSDYDNIFHHISGKSKIYGIELRNRLYEYYNINPYYQVISENGQGRNISQVKLEPFMLLSIDLIKLALKNMPEDKAKESKFLSLIKIIDEYIAAYSFAISNKEDMTPSMILERKVKEQLQAISPEEYSDLMHSYFDSLKPKEVFRDNQVEIRRVRKSAKIMKNINNFGLMKSFNGKLLNGKIDISSDIGYSDPYKTQDDAVGSAVIDENHYINIVADGVGGVDNGNSASQYLVNQLIEWYRSLPASVLDDVPSLKQMISDKLAEINHIIAKKYYDVKTGRVTAQTTVVIALTTSDKTIIANVGDSTAYTYDKDMDELVKLTIIDSKTKKYDYETARRRPDNREITASIGGDYSKVHFHEIDNIGQRIILSSDGVTDLISKNNFKKIFKNQASANDIVTKAKYFADVDSTFPKTEDNISAIVIDLPNREHIYGRGY